jgi:spermidine/putrescine transport system ATP-binding protein
MLNVSHPQLFGASQPAWQNSQKPDRDEILRVTNVLHSYGETMALDHVSLRVQRGEFLTILGESGSGKTTMLRVIAGLERPTSIDELSIDGIDVSDMPAAQRACRTVFQNYALFPHMSVEENVGYGLKLAGVTHAERRSRTVQALAMVRLGAKGTRRISQLSGGERQRVALARAIVTRPPILLLDEPLGALDEKLRYDMQAELVEIHKELGITFIYITHSQEAALTMSDRIVLMRNGRIEQCGTPEDLFDRPRSRFAAEFMGFDNILRCTVDQSSAGRHVQVRVGDTLLMASCPDGVTLEAGQTAQLAIRAERLRPLSGNARADENVMACHPDSHLYRGKYTDHIAQLENDQILKVRTWDRSDKAGRFDAVACRPDDCIVLPQ